MLIVTEMNAGKILDEACNNNNDVYSDEALYAAWAERPRVEPRLLEAEAAQDSKSSSICKGFMAHLNAAKG